MDCLDEDEARRLLKAARPERLYALYVLALTTGMRQGELLGLQWRDLNIAGNESSVVVMRTLDANAPRLVAKDTKTPWSRRKNDLIPSCAKVLKNHQRAMNSEGHRISPWVFCNTDGNPYYRGNLVRQHFNPLLEKAGIRHIRFHDLRHSAATLMLAGGVNIKVVSQMLGHKDVLITLNRYGHILPSMQDQAVAAMTKLFGSI